MVDVLVLIVIAENNAKNPREGLYVTRTQGKVN